MSQNDSESRPDGGAGDFSAGDWEDIFPFDPYAEQEDAIEKLIEEIRAGGLSVIEAACGSGKTLIALCGGIAATRDPRLPIERVVCVTSVKQQMRAFEDDVEAINQHLPADMDPVSSLSMVGKADLCAYVGGGQIDGDDIYGECDSLRDPVRTVASVDAADKADKLHRMADRADVSGAEKGTVVQGDDWQSPYHTDIPTTSEGDNEGAEYCPFYAGHRAEKAEEATSLDTGEDGYHPEGVVRPWDLMAEAAADGACPHSRMMDGIKNAEVLVGNYKHIIHPLTVEAMTQPIIGDDTFLVVDEAHNLVSEARDELSDGVAFSTLERAKEEIETHVLEHDGRSGQIVRDEVQKQGYTGDDLQEFMAFIEDLRDWISQRAVLALDSEDEQWHEHPDELEEAIEVSLGDPEENMPDDLAEWAAEEGYLTYFGNEHRLRKGEHVEDPGMFREAKLMADAICDGFEMAEEETSYQRTETYVDTVGRVLGRWATQGFETYFRQMEVVPRKYERNTDLDWDRHFRVSLELKNCIPSDEIAERLAQFGSGVLMSATLAPLDVYEETVGIAKLAEEGRSTRREVYGLAFPRENRESVAVNLPKFTYGNRGPTYEPKQSDAQEQVRQSYYRTVKATVTDTPGNVLVAMPSYAEAEWIGDELRYDSEVSKDILVDESSTNAVTEDLKAEFFAGDGKVLVTGLRGTLTEGVDFDGDRLRGCVVCGVPIRSTAGDYPTAIQTAYEAEFGSNNGFDYAFTIPAVHKSRQALGRVIRGDDETGVRVLADGRYAHSHNWQDVREYLPDYERDDYEPIELANLGERLNGFWATRN